MADFFDVDGTPNEKALAGLTRPSQLHAVIEALQDRLAAAKAGNDRAELQAAKRAVFYFRSYWRGVAAAVGGNPPGPAPQTVQAHARPEKVS